jgi:hypothetical protein
MLQTWQAAKHFAFDARRMTPKKMDKDRATHLNPYTNPVTAMDPASALAEITRKRLLCVHPISAQIFREELSKLSNYGIYLSIAN